MATVNRVCKVCGKGYFYCNTCEESKRSPLFMNVWCSENCKNIFEIISGFAQGSIDKATAKKKLEACDLHKMYTFSEKIRNYIDTINAEEKTPVKEEKKIKKNYYQGRKSK